MMSVLGGVVNGGTAQRLGAFLAATIIGRLCVAIFCPLAAIALKWIIIGRYRKGTYRMYVLHIESYSDVR